MGDYRYHELHPLISYFPCHWVVPDDYPNTCPMKKVRTFYRIIARYGRDIYTLTQSFPNQQWYNKSTYDLVERILFPLSFYRRYIKFTERYSDVSTFRMIFNSIHLTQDPFPFNWCHHLNGVSNIWEFSEIQIFLSAPYWCNRYYNQSPWRLWLYYHTAVWSYITAGALLY